MNNFSCTKTLKSDPILNFSSGTMLHVFFVLFSKEVFQFILGCARKIIFHKRKTNSLSDRLNCYLGHSSALLSRVLTDNIMKTCPCNIKRFFSPVKIENFIGFFKIFFLFLLKT